VRHDPGSLKKQKVEEKKGLAESAFPDRPVDPGSRRRRRGGEGRGWDLDSKHRQDWEGNCSKVSVVLVEPFSD